MGEREILSFLVIIYITLGHGDSLYLNLQKCKCRLQPPSGIELPGHNPFLPPPAITQIMLIANPNKVKQ